MNRGLRRFLAAVWVLGLSAAAAFAKPYGNARFGFFVEVPPAFSVKDPEPENGDGQSFHSADGAAQLSASGSWLVDVDFAGQVALYKTFERDDGWTITYESTVGKSSASYSGTKGGRIFYRHMILSCNGQAQANYWLEYPAAENATYDRLVKGLNASLKAGNGSCNP